MIKIKLMNVEGSILHVLEIPNEKPLPPEIIKWKERMFVYFDTWYGQTDEIDFLEYREATEILECQ